MPLGVREVILVIRAQNLAVGVFRGLNNEFQQLDRQAQQAAKAQMQRGVALMSLGAGMAVVGATAVKFFYDSAQAAVEYNRQSALTLTQTHGLGATLKQVSDIGKRVAAAIPVPFDEIQQSLYDIFSSMDVNVRGAETLLKGFAKAAVAGQVSTKDAGRAIIAVLNAWHLAASKVNNVNDVMFQLVRYGVGTYGEFASTIGRAIPSAVRAGQSFQELAGMMAFLTRNGLSAAMASTSAARALDAMSNPKTIANFDNLGKVIEGSVTPETLKRLQALGVNFADISVKVTDAQGRFRPINQVMTDLGVVFQKLGLSAEDTSAVLQDMFKGAGGTIQARRFFNLAVKNFGDLNHLMNAMYNSRGALQAAYDTMKNTPAMQIQQLKNNFKLLQVEVGEAALPVLLKIVSVFADMIAQFNKLSPGVKKAITYAALLTTGLTLLAGAVLVLAGAWLVLTAAGTGVVLTIGLVVAAVAAVAVGAYFLIKNWSTVSKFFHDVWFAIWHWIDQTWNLILGKIHGAWSTIVGWFTSFGRTIEGLWNTAWNAIAGAVSAPFNAIVGFFTRVKNFITSSFDAWWASHGEMVKQVWRGVWDAIKTVWDWIVNLFRAAWKVISGVSSQMWTGISDTFRIGVNVILKIVDAFVTLFKSAWILGFGIVKTVVQIGWLAIQTIFRVVSAVVVAIWNTFWAVIVNVLKAIWATIKFVLKTAWDTIVVIFSVFLSLITGHWGRAWTDIKNFGTQIWNNIKGFLSGIWNSIYNIAKVVWNNMKAMWIGVFNAVWSWLQGWGKTIWNFFVNTIPGWFKTAIKGIGKAWDAVKSAVSAPIKWVINIVINDGIIGIFNRVSGWFHGPQIKPWYPLGKKKGGFIDVGTTPTADDVPLLGSKGEYMVQAKAVDKYGVQFMDALNAGKLALGGLIKGYATGGLLGGITGVPVNIAKIIAGVITGNWTATGNAFRALLPLPDISKKFASQWAGTLLKIPEKLLSSAVAWMKGNLYGNGQNIVAYARQFVGRVPYVWGGDDPTGWDCSGFTSWVYHHFGIPAPRTSQKQQLWARPSRDIAGALAFFYGSGGTASHVGISTGTGSVINAYGTGYGTIISPLTSFGRSLSGFGIPPMGFGSVGVQAGSLPGGSNVIELGRAMAAAAPYGWTGEQWTSLFSLWNRESHWDPKARNPRTGAAGIPQDITGNFHGGAAGQIAWGLGYIYGRYGNPINAWNFWRTNGWYDRGGYLPPGWSLALNTTGKPEPVGESASRGDVKITINTQEINPVKHAADLGWELSRRSW